MVVGDPLREPGDSLPAACRIDELDIIAQTPPKQLPSIVGVGLVPGREVIGERRIHDASMTRRAATVNNTRYPVGSRAALRLAQHAHLHAIDQPPRFARISRISGPSNWPTLAKPSSETRLPR